MLQLPKPNPKVRRGTDVEKPDAASIPAQEPRQVKAIRVFEH